MGEVWLAQHTTNRKRVALKLLHKDKFNSIDRYLLVRREIEAQANLKHPHIVSIIDVGLPALHQTMSQEEMLERLTAEPMYVAFEYVEESRTLGDLIQGDRLSHERIAELIAALADALAYAHQQGAYHLDVKPANVLIDREGKLLLADFGLSSLAGGGSGGSSGGTPLYMSPERLRTGDHHGAAGDIWSLGVVLYELLTGERPFPKVANIKDSQFQYRPIPELNADTPPLFVDLCNGCLARDHNHRIASAGHVAAELQQWLDDQLPRPRTRQMAIGLAVLLLLVLGGVGYGVARLAGLVGGTAEQVADVKDEVKKTREAVREESQKTLAEIQKLYADPDVLTGKLKSHIRKRADEEIATAKTDKADWRKIDEIEKRRDTALSRVDDLVATIRDGLAGKPDPIFAEAARILAEKGVDEALTFLEAKQPAIESRVKAQKARRDQAAADAQQAEHEFRQTLKPWLLEAELHETNLAFDKALKAYELVASEAPQWSRARRQLGMLLDTLACYPEAEPHLQAALDLAEDDRQRSRAANELGLLYLDQVRHNEAEPLLELYLELGEQLYGPDDSETSIALNNLAQLLQETNRLAKAERLMRRALAIDEQRVFGAGLPTSPKSSTEDLPTDQNTASLETDGQPSAGSGDPRTALARDLNNLARLLQAMNRLAEAEPLMRRALAIDEQSYSAEHPEVAIHLNNLALLLQETNRLSEAEPLMRRALAIDEQSYGTEHPKVAIRLNNLALLLQDTNRLSRAEPMYRRALAIDEQSFGIDHPSVARALNNLAELLRVTNRLSEAEPMYRRALAIDEQSFGTEHPEVAIRLNNLALLLKATNRLAEAEPLYRRALAIDKQSFGTEHPKIATKLNNLATLLQATNRLAEAEPLYRRAMVIDEQSYGTEHPKVAIRLNNLAQLLQDTNRLAMAEPLMRRALAIIVLSGKAIGREHPYFPTIKSNYVDIIKAMELSEDDIALRLQALKEVSSPLEPMVPEVERLLGPAKPVAAVFAALDRQYKEEGKPEVYFLPLDEPIALHLDELLSPAKSTEEVIAALDAHYREQGKPAVWFLPLDEPIAPHLDELLGPAKSTEEVLADLDTQYREQGKPEVWFLPLDEPISPHLDQLLDDGRQDLSK
jgi:tetratricopeptide (TPR) repeat protein